MKVTNSQIVNGNTAMSMISPAITDNVVRMRLILIDKALEPVLSTYQQVRATIVGKYAQTDDEGKHKTENNRYVWKEECAEEASKEVVKLDTAEIDLLFTPISQDALFASIDYSALSPDLVDDINGDKVLKYNILYAISWMIA